MSFLLVPNGIIKGCPNTRSVEQQGFDDFTKAGFARLLKHFEDNTDDVVKLTRAFALANKAHKGQHLDNEPHVNHAIRVALVLAEELQIHDCDLASAALLHDALETLPEEDVRSECGDRVVEIARPASGLAHSKHEEKALGEYFGKLSKASKESRLVKIAERLDTARAMKSYAYRDRALRFKDETQKHALPVAQGTDERLAFKLSVALYEIK